MMTHKDDKTKLPGVQAGNGKPDNLQGYPVYPADEDIYSRSLKEDDINPEDMSRSKDANEQDNPGTGNEKDFRDDLSGDDLDVPGSELDDDEENTGGEDEENNYYSLGGDTHDP